MVVLGKGLAKTGRAGQHFLSRGRQRESLRTGWKRFLFVSLSFLLETSSVGAKCECRNRFITLFPTRGHKSLPRARTPLRPRLFFSCLNGTTRTAHGLLSTNPTDWFLLATSCLASGRLQDNFLVTFSKYSNIYVLRHGPEIHPVINCCKDDQTNRGGSWFITGCIWQVKIEDIITSMSFERLAKSF